MSRYNLKTLCAPLVIALSACNGESNILQDSYAFYTQPPGNNGGGGGGGGDGGGGGQSISDSTQFQSLIDAAVSGGEVVLTKDYTINKEILLNKGIILKSNGTPRKITINVSNQPVFTLNTVSGFTFDNVEFVLTYCNYQFISAPTDANGNPIYTGLTIKDSIINANHSECNYISVNDFILKNTTVYGNAPAAGGVLNNSILFLTGTDFSLLGNTVIDTKSSYLSAIQIYSSISGVLTANLFSSASNSNSGIITFFDSSSVNISRNAFINKNQGQSNAIYSVGNVSSVSLTNNIYNTQNLLSVATGISESSNVQTTGTFLQIFNNSELATPSFTMSCNATTNNSILTTNSLNLPLTQTATSSSLSGFVYYPGSVRPSCN